MEIVIVNMFGQTIVRTASFVPREGDFVDAFYEPSPKVIKVLAFPSAETLGKIGLPTGKIEAIVFVQ